MKILGHSPSVSLEITRYQGNATAQTISTPRCGFNKRQAQMRLLRRGFREAKNPNVPVTIIGKAAGPLASTARPRATYSTDQYPELPSRTARAIAQNDTVNRVMNVMSISDKRAYIMTSG